MSTVETKKTNDIERMANIGKRIELKYLGSVVVKEPSLEKIIKVIAELKILLDEVNKKTSDEQDFIYKALSNPSMMQSLKVFASICTDRGVSDFNDLPVSDWLRLVAAIKEVVVWEEITELFFQIVPREILERLTTK